MPTRAGVGESKDTDSFKAGVEAAQGALAQAGVEKCDLVLLFATVDHDQARVLEGVRSVTGDAPLSGCSAEGVITQTGPAGEGVFTQAGWVNGESAATVMVLASDSMRFFTCCSHDLKADSRQSGEEVGKKVQQLQGEKPRLLLMFPDGLSVNTAAFYAGIEATLQEPLPFCGGAASDNMSYTQTFQYYNDQVLSDSATCVAVCGDVDYAIGVNHGCLPIGLDKTVTRAEQNCLYEIENEPAWEFFKQYLDESVEDLTVEAAGVICLGERLPEEDVSEYDQYIIRIPIGQNEDGSLLLSTEMETGSKVRMTRRDPERISLGAKQLAEKIKRELGDKKPSAVLQFDCAARGKTLFGPEVKEKGVDVIQDVLGKDIPWVGFYTYGELAPIGDKNYAHTATVALCVIC